MQKIANMNRKVNLSAQVATLFSLVMNTVSTDNLLRPNKIFVRKAIPSRIFTHLATLLDLAMLQQLRAQTLAPSTPFPL